jgi:osmotically-inducible protein OsmY
MSMFRLTTAVVVVFVFGSVACGPSEPPAPETSAAIAAPMSDEGIAAAVKARIDADPMLKPAAISVTVENGVASLESPNTDKAQRDLAIRLAREVAGVQDVVDRMK